MKPNETIMELKEKTIGVSEELKNLTEEFSNLKTKMKKAQVILDLKKIEIEAKMESEDHCVLKTDFVNIFYKTDKVLKYPEDFIKLKEEFKKKEKEVKKKLIEDEEYNIKLTRTFTHYE